MKATIPRETFLAIVNNLGAAQLGLPASSIVTEIELDYVSGSGYVVRFNYIPHVKPDKTEQEATA